MELEKPRRYRTQGIKGARAPRINMAFDPDNYAYIRAQAARDHKTMTLIVNEAVRARMQNEERAT